MRYLSLIFILLFIGCSQKQPQKSKSATVIFKTPSMKFYDKGFITYYDNHIHLQVLNIGKVVLNLKIYDTQICQSTFKCLDNHTFNERYLDKSYPDTFMMDLFRQDKIYFKDKPKKIMIKVIKD